jgi:hypothetical protein
MSAEYSAGSATVEAKNPGASGLPLCREPWQSLYILRRGILPCCYGGAVLGEMEDFAAVWNGPEMQELRRCLSRGELAPYCLENPGCPIVQRVLAQSAPAPASPPHAPAPAGGLGAFFRRLVTRLTGRLRRTGNRH